MGGGGAIFAKGGTTTLNNVSFTGNSVIAGTGGLLKATAQAADVFICSDALTGVSTTVCNTIVYKSGSTETTEIVGSFTVDNPTLSTLFPANDATDISPSTNLVLTLNKNAAIGTGNILIKKTSDDAIVKTMDVAGGQVSVSNAVVTIDPSVTLDSDTTYYVQIEATALEDTAGNAYAGIGDTDTTSWRFTTAVGSTEARQRNPRSLGNHRNDRNPRHYRNTP